MADMAIGQGIGEGGEAVSIMPSRPKAWVLLAFGWMLAQSLLTLIPLAPQAWAAWALGLASLPFVVMALRGLRILIRRGPVLEITGQGLTLWPQSAAAFRLDWTEIASWRLVPSGPRRIEVRVTGEVPTRAGPLLNAIMRLRRRLGRPELVFVTWDVDGTLTPVAIAFRESAPHLEEPP